MSSDSNWIPSRRIRLTASIGLVLAAGAAEGASWTPYALALLFPAAAAGWIVFVLVSIRRQLSSGWQERIHRNVISRLALTAGFPASVLDIGCGDASLLTLLAEDAPGIMATGVDYWGEDWDYAQAACRARLPAATFQRMDAAKLDFPDASFDAVVSVMCFHEVSSPVQAVAEALRVLRPGGTFVLVDRFASSADYPPGDLADLLAGAGEVRRTPLVTALGIPWPLSSARAMGRAEMLAGRR